MKQLLLILFFVIPTGVFAQEYNLSINLNDGDICYYVDIPANGVQCITNSFEYRFINTLDEKRKIGKAALPILWIDLTDTTTFRYYKKNNKCYMYEIIDKSFGRNNAIQENEYKRPIFDRQVGRIYFPEGTCLEFTINYKEYKMSGIIDKYMPNSIYFFAFLSKNEYKTL